MKRWQNRNNRTNSEIEQKASLGEQISLCADNNPDKQQAIEEFAAGNFRQAQLGFMNSLESNSNDPESSIYLNNSLAAIDGESIKIGVRVPIGGSLNVAKEILPGVTIALNLNHNIF